MVFKSYSHLGIAKGFSVNTKKPSKIPSSFGLEGILHPGHGNCMLIIRMGGSYLCSYEYSQTWATLNEFWVLMKPYEGYCNKK